MQVSNGSEDAIKKKAVTTNRKRKMEITQEAQAKQLKIDSLLNAKKQLWAKVQNLQVFQVLINNYISKRVCLLLFTRKLLE